MGQLLDRQSYPRRQGKGAMVTATAPDGTPLVAKLDGADLRAGVLHETKRGRSCEDAHVWQVRFYLWVLGLRGVTAPDGRPLRGRIDYPALRRTEPVELLPEHKARLAEIVADVRAMASDPAVPARFPRRSFCRRCAYEELCYA